MLPFLLFCMISTALPGGRIQRFLHRHLEARDRSFFHQALNADVRDYNIPGALKPLKNASSQRGFTLENQWVIDFVYRGILEPFNQ